MCHVGRRPPEVHFNYYFFVGMIPLRKIYVMQTLGPFVNLQVLWRQPSKMGRGPKRPCLSFASRKDILTGKHEMVKQPQPPWPDFTLVERYTDPNKTLQLVFTAVLKPESERNVCSCVDFPLPEQPLHQASNCNSHCLLFPFSIWFGCVTKKIHWLHWGNTSQSCGVSSYSSRPRNPSRYTPAVVLLLQ